MVNIGGQKKVRSNRMLWQRILCLVGAHKHWVTLGKYSVYTFFACCQNCGKHYRNHKDYKEVIKAYNRANSKLG
jgi:hypothetical protein